MCEFVLYYSMGVEVMENSEKLMNAMRLGRVYRRQELAEFSTSVDRDLKTLVESGRVKKLSGGLYCRPRLNAFGSTPPEEKDLVQAFLKTNDFLLTSYSHFNQFGLGLTQVYNHYVVYNHKRTGEYTLGGKRFKFLMVPAYPKKLCKEFLLVDLLNNLKRLPDNTSSVRENLKSRWDDFDGNKVGAYLDRYGKAGAKEFLREVHA